MKKILLSLCSVLLLVGTVSAQQNFYRTAYFMEGSTFRGNMNPAFRPYRGYVDIPVLGNITLDLNTTSLTAQNLFFPKDGKLLPFYHEDVSWDMISKGLQSSNGVDVNFKTDIISFGFYSGRSFWSFSLGAKVDAGFKLPKQMFEFIKVGSGNYDMKDLSLGVTATMSASLGYSYKLFENLTVGGRVNFLGGIGRANIHYDELKLQLDKDMWKVNAVGVVDVAMTGVSIDDNVEDDGTYLDLSSIGFGFKGLAGQGLSFDIGAEYVLLDRFKFSASILDMGFMKWNKKAVTRGKSKAEFEFAGVYYDENEGQFDNIGNFDDFLKFERQTSQGVKSKIYPTIILGAEVDILGNNLLGFGIMYMNKRGEFVDRSELSLALTVRPASWVSVAANYSLIHHKGSSGLSNLGLALNFHARWINFFVGTDYMVSAKLMPKYFIPINQSQFNVYMGIAVPLGKEKPMELRKLGI